MPWSGSPALKNDKYYSGGWLIVVFKHFKAGFLADGEGAEHWGGFCILLQGVTK